MAAMGEEVRSLHDIQHCHPVYYEDVKVNAHVRVYTETIIIIIIIIIVSLCSTMI
jgi:hypothetical protein